MKAPTFGYLDAFQQETPGFDFSRSQNSELSKAALPKFLKTGTTIAGVMCKDGVALAADTRATMGTVIAEKKCLKLGNITGNIWGAGAGVSADLHHMFRTMSADMKLFSYSTDEIARLETVVTRMSKTLFRYQGYVVVACILGGVGPTGEPGLCYVSPDGFRYTAPFMAMGSGGYYATSMLESKYRDDLSLEEAAELAADAIEAGVLNDEGSGTTVDVVMIPKSDPKNPILKRGYRDIVKQERKAKAPLIPAGTTVVISETRRPVTNSLVDVSEYL